jgi:hypothetical protein
MTEDEMKALLAERDAEIEKLKNDKHAALGEKNKANAAAKAAQDAADQAERNAAEKSGDIETLKASLEKKHKADLKSRDDKITGYENRLSELLIDNAVKTALTQLGVPPEHARAATLLMKDGVTMVNGEAMVGDVPFADHLASWAKSDEAKHYTAAPNNTGAGASGSTAKATTSMTAAELNTPDGFAKFTQIAKDNPELASQIAKNAGVPHFAPIS